MVFLSKLQWIPLKLCFLPSAVSLNAESEELGGGTDSNSCWQWTHKINGTFKRNKNVLGQKEKNWKANKP